MRRVFSLGGLCVIASAAVVASSSATVGGRNGLLVYQSQVGAHTQLFTIKPDGSGAHQITRLTDSEAITAAWSPDGKRIAFARDYSAGTPKEHLDIAVINADGSGLHAFGLHGLNASPSWSADGRFIIWARSNSGLSIANADGSGLRAVNIGVTLLAPPSRPTESRSRSGGKNLTVHPSTSLPLTATG